MGVNFRLLISETEHINSNVTLHALSKITKYYENKCVIKS